MNATVPAYLPTHLLHLLCLLTYVSTWYCTHAPTHLLFVPYHTVHLCLTFPSSGDSEALSSLDLSWNHIRGKGAVAIANGIKVCSMHEHTVHT